MKVYNVSNKVVERMIGGVPYIIQPSGFVEPKDERDARRLVFENEALSEHPAGEVPDLSGTIIGPEKSEDIDHSKHTTIAGVEKTKEVIPDLSDKIVNPEPVKKKFNLFGKAKKVVALVAGSMLLASVCQAAPAFMIDSGADFQSTFATSCSSNTATKVIAATDTEIRLGFTIHDPSLTTAVYYSTYAATAKTGLLQIGATTYYRQDVNCYKGDIYILTEPGIAPVTVDGELRWK